MTNFCKNKQKSFIRKPNQRFRNKIKSRNHQQLAERPPRRSPVDLPVPGVRRRTVQLRLPRRVRGAAPPRGTDSPDNPEELPGVQRSPPPAQIPLLFLPRLRQGRPGHLAPPGLHRRQQPVTPRRVIPDISLPPGYSPLDLASSQMASIWASVRSRRSRPSRMVCSSR